MAPPRRARAPRPRPRRGSVERPVNARLVRGTWLLVALPLLLTAFSVARPAAAAAADAAADLRRRDRRAARPRARARTIRTARPDRPAAWAQPPGSRTSSSSTASSRASDRSRPDPGPRARSSYRTSSPSCAAHSQRAIVITAHRDNIGEGAGRQPQRLRAQAPLIELARAYASVGGARRVQASRRTRSCSSRPTAALRRARRGHFAESSPYRENALAVISLDALAGAGTPRLLIAGDTAAVARRLARAHRGGPRARADRHGAGAGLRPPPAPRPRLPVHPRRAGARSSRAASRP